jgi:predicted nucleic acid-binding protein
MPAFWDASAIVPLCVSGQAEARGREMLREHKPVVWWGTAVEVVSALIRLQREGHLSATQAKSAGARLDMLQRAWREVQPVADVRDLAIEQLRRFNLRAADALQLAAALVWCNLRPARRPFLCGDRRLADAARQAGFTLIEF